MPIKIENLPGYQPMGSEKKQKKEIKEELSLKATINIDTNTGKIAIIDETKRIKFNFTNIDLAKKWADAVR